MSVYTCSNRRSRPSSVGRPRSASRSTSASLAVSGVLPVSGAAPPALDRSPARLWSWLQDPRVIAVRALPSPVCTDPAIGQSRRQQTVTVRRKRPAQDRDARRFVATILQRLSVALLTLTTPKCCPAAAHDQQQPSWAAWHSSTPTSLRPFAVSGPRSASSWSWRCSGTSPAGTLHPTMRRGRSTTIRRSSRSRRISGRRPGAAGAGTGRMEAMGLGWSVARGPQRQRKETSRPMPAGSGGAGGESSRPVSARRPDPHPRPNARLSSPA
jgi:hypothetical protein